MQVFLDESGDLGWSFNEQYRAGGSSRYITLAFMFLPLQHIRRPKRIIQSLYRRYKWQSEKKAANATSNQKIEFSQKVVQLLERYRDIKIDVVTVQKQNVQEHIRADANKLYNYIAGLVMPEYIRHSDQVQFIPDERSIKVKSGNSLVDYLQTKLWFELDLRTTIINSPGKSHEQYNLQFVDWIAHCIWIKFEDRITGAHDLILPHIRHRQLFFR